MDEKADDVDLACQAKRGGCSRFALRGVAQTVLRMRIASRRADDWTSNRRDRPADDKKIL